MNIFNFNLPTNWSIVDLPDLVFYQEGPGVRNNQYTSSGVKLLNVANLQEGKLVLDNTDRYISEEEAYGRYKHFLVDEGDLIVACSGIKVEYFDKKMGFVKKEHLPLCMNTSTIRFKSLDSSVLDIRYFMYFLKSNYFKKQLQRLITGSAQLNFGPSHLKQIKVILPDISTQKYIVALLDKSQDLIMKRKAQIEALDQLTQSVFLEMFGDPRSNPKNFNKVSLGELFEIKTGGTPSRNNKDYWNGDIPWVKTTEVNENVIIQTEEFISEEGLSNSNAVLLPANTLLIAMYGQGKTRGRTAKLGIEATTNQACAALLPNTEIEQDFIWKQLIIQYEELRSLGRGGNQPNLNLNLVRQFEVIVPPDSMQREFVGIIKKIDNTKNILKQSMEDLENMFNSLMQRAFKGELFTEEKVFNL